MRVGNPCRLLGLRVGCRIELLSPYCLSTAPITVQVEIPRSEVRADLSSFGGPDETKLSSGRELLERRQI